MPASSSMSDQEILEINIIAALKLEALPDDQKVQLLDNIATLVQKRAMLEIINRLTEDEKSSLDALITEKGQESPEIADFLRTHIDNIEDMFRKELAVVKRELIDQAEQFEQAIEK